MAQDVIEIAEYARKRLSKPKLILIGHSWGAMLGLNVIKRRPELFYAFVGTGQPVSWTLSLEDREHWTRKKATMERDEQTLKLLDETANLAVDDMKRITASSKWRISPSDKEYLKIQSAFVGQPQFLTKGDVADWVAGGGFTMSKLGPVHGAVHPEVSIILSDCPCRFPQVELHAVESGSGDVLLGLVDSDPVPVLERAIPEARVEQSCELILRSRDAT